MKIARGRLHQSLGYRTPYQLYIEEKSER